MAFGASHMYHGIKNGDAMETTVGGLETAGGAGTVVLTSAALKGSAGAAKALPIVGNAIAAGEGIYAAAKPWVGKDAANKDAVTKSMESTKEVAKTGGGIVGGMVAAGILTAEAAVGTTLAVGATGAVVGAAAVGGAAYVYDKLGNKLANDYENDPALAKQAAASEAKFNNQVPKTDIGHYTQLSKLTQQAGLKGNPTPQELETALAKKQETLDGRSGVSKAWDFTKSFSTMRGLARDETPAEKERAEINGMKQELTVYKKASEKAPAADAAKQQEPAKTAQQLAAEHPDMAAITQNLKSHGAEVKDHNLRQQLASTQSTQRGLA